LTSKRSNGTPLDVGDRWWPPRPETTTLHRIVREHLETCNTLGYEKHAQEGRDGGNSRNGKTGKRVKTDRAEMGIEVPRDRNGTFDPQMVAKGQR